MQTSTMNLGSRSMSSGTIHSDTEHFPKRFSSKSDNKWNYGTPRRAQVVLLGHGRKEQRVGQRVRSNAPTTSLSMRAVIWDWDMHATNATRDVWFALACWKERYSSDPLSLAIEVRRPKPTWSIGCELHNRHWRSARRIPWVSAIIRPTILYTAPNDSIAMVVPDALQGFVGWPV